MKICGVCVLYNPDMSVIENIESYIPILDELIIFDNSESPNLELIKYLENVEKIKITSYGENLGIAYALKYGLDYAVKNNYDFCLTMDQDSKFPSIDYNYILSYLKTDDIDDYGIIGLNYMDKNDKQPKLVERKLWITSGNFINIKNYKLINGFNVDLFIDYVDFELCEQFYKIGKKVAYIDDAVLIHHLGNPICKKILFKTVTSMNHAPIRYYYRYRNLYYLYARNKKLYRENYKAEKRNIIKMFLFEKNRRQKYKMIRKGIKDAKRGILGKYHE